MQQCFMLNGSAGKQYQVWLESVANCRFHVQMSSEYPVMAAGRARLTGIPMINKEVVLPRQGSDATIMAL